MAVGLQGGESVMQTFKVYSKGNSWFFWGDENKNVIDQFNAKMIAAGSKIRGDYCFFDPEGYE